MFNRDISVFSNIKSWYLDNNSFKQGTQHSGTLEVWGDPSSENENVIKSIFIDIQSYLWLLIEKQNKIQLLSTPDGTWKDKNIIGGEITDVAYDNINDVIYLLEKVNNRIYQVNCNAIRYYGEIKLSDYKYFSINKFSLSLNSRLTIKHVNNEPLPILYITTTDIPFIYELNLNNKIIQAESLKIVWSKEIKNNKKINKTLHPLSITCDNQNASLLIADASNNAIFEYKFNNNKLYLICGTGIAGISNDNVSSISAQINNPSDIAVFNYTDFFDEGSFSKKSKKNLKDINRCIYFTDSGNNKIKKILNINGDLILFTLIGNGDGNKFKTKNLLNQDNILSNRSIYKPKRIAFGPNGMLAILQDNAEYIIVLKPSSNKQFHSSRVTNFCS